MSVTHWYGLKCKWFGCSFALSYRAVQCTPTLEFNVLFMICLLFFGDASMQMTNPTWLCCVDWVFGMNWLDELVRKQAYYEYELTVEYATYAYVNARFSLLFLLID